MRRLAPLSLMLLALAIGLPFDTASQTPPGSDVNDPDLTEWEVPWAESRPRDPFVGPDGRVWFVGQRTSYAAVLDPQTGEFEQCDLDGAGPHNLIVDADGTVYYAGNRAVHIGKLDPETCEIEKIMMPDERAGDPHTLVWDANGDIWFTVQQGNFIGHLTKATGEVRLIQAPEVEGGRSSSSRPYGIKMDSKNRPWIVLFNTNKIAMADPATFELKIFDLPDERTRPRRLVIDSKDVIWYADYSRGYLGRLDPETGEVREWANPGGERSRPYGMAIDDDDRVWFVETGVDPNTFVGFDSETEEFISVVPVESGAGAIRHMYYDSKTRSIWFGTDANTVGRAVVPPRRTTS